MKKIFLKISVLVVICFISFSAQWVKSNGIKAIFSNDEDANAFMEKAENKGLGEGAWVEKVDGVTAIRLPDAAKENMSEIAIDAIEENATGITLINDLAINYESFAVSEETDQNSNILIPLDCSDGMCTSNVYPYITIHVFEDIYQSCTTFEGIICADITIQGSNRLGPYEGPYGHFAHRFWITEPGIYSYSRYMVVEDSAGPYGLKYTFTVEIIEVQ